MTWLRKNHFTLLLLAAVAMAFIFPEGGRSGGYFRGEITTRIGIVLIFLIQGLGLPTRTLAAGVCSWRLHLFIQSWNFLLTPAVLWLFLLVVRPLLDPAAWSGFWYLSILPTTISSAVALTVVARGDAAGAIFNATLSNVLGVFLVPIWAVFLFSLGNEDGGAHVGGLFGNLIRLILLPLLAGQLLRPLLAGHLWFPKLKSIFPTLSGGIIIHIVYVAFCESVASGGWSRFGPGFIVKLVLLVAAFLALVAAAVWWTSPLVGRDPGRRIAAFFCGSQKTLAAGVPMANALFAGTNSQSASIDPGLLLLPLLIYHSLQLLLAGVIIGPIPRR